MIRRKISDNAYNKLYGKIQIIRVIKKWFQYYNFPKHALNPVKF